MSGIFGLYYRDQQKVDKETLNSMGASMSHRGPDGIAIWSENNIGLGHCMLSTTPESVAETLPYVDKDNGLVITADARIDAREELASKLGLSQRLKDGIADSQLILAAYCKWQTKCVHHLVGDFAFLIWDRKQQQIFCARDHLGVKPFYYHLSAQVLVAGSEVQAILSVSQVPRRINQARIADYLVPQLEGVDKTSTFYEPISRLPPAHTLLISRDKKLIEQYWHLDSETETRYKSDDEYVEAFHDIFKKSVHDRLRCNGQVTSMLSGGIDSSYIVGTARQLLQGSAPLPVYSAVSVRDPDCRETHFIKSVIAQGGVDSTMVHPRDTLEYVEELLMTNASPEYLFDTGMTLQMLLYLKARDRGHRVMLDGVEGDLVHSLSTSYPTSLFRRGHCLSALAESFNIWRNTYRKQLSLNDVFKSTIRGAFIPEFLRHWRRRAFSKSTLADILKASIINQDFAKEIDIRARLARLDGYGDPVAHASLREKQVQNIMHPYLTVALERYDRVAALCAIEPRHPLLDKRLVEFSVSLPWEQKVRHGWSKYIIRRAGESFLPHEVVWRQGWDWIDWSFASTFTQKHSVWMTEQIEEKNSLLERYVDCNMPRDEESIWCVFHLLNWLQINIQNGAIHHDDKEESRTANQTTEKGLFNTEINLLWVY